MGNLYVYLGGYFKLFTTRKQALGLPQKYRYEDEPVPMLVYLMDGIYGIYGWALDTSWYYQPVPDGSS